MSANIADFAEFLRSQQEAFIETLTDMVKLHVGGFYVTAPRDQVRTSAQRLTAGWMEALRLGDPSPIREMTKVLSRGRAVQNVAPTNLLGALDCVRRALWGALRQFFELRGGFDADLVETLESWMHAERQVVLESYADVLQDTRQQLTEREQLLADQTKLIQELSTPIVPILTGVLILPMVGVLDQGRAAQIMEAVLSQIQANRASVLILDVTGVPTIDTTVAHHLLQLARAVELLGAQVVMVGIRPEIARTVVQMGVDMGSLTTLANLQSGIAHALKLRGLCITRDTAKPDSEHTEAARHPVTRR